MKLHWCWWKKLEESNSKIKWWPWWTARLEGLSWWVVMCRKGERDSCTQNSRVWAQGTNQGRKDRRFWNKWREFWTICVRTMVVRLREFIIALSLLSWIHFKTGIKQIYHWFQGLLYSHLQQPTHTTWKSPRPSPSPSTTSTSTRPSTTTSARPRKCGRGNSTPCSTRSTGRGTGTFECIGGVHVRSQKGTTSRQTAKRKANLMKKICFRKRKNSI